MKKGQRISKEGTWQYS